MLEVLIVEDSTALGGAIKQAIETTIKIPVTWCQSYAEAQDAIKNKGSNFFIALLDINLPDAPQGEVIDFVLSKKIPSIIFTGEFSDDARDFIWSKKNVVDYVVKEGIYTIYYVVGLIHRIYKNRNIKVMVVDDSKFSRVLMVNLLKVHQYIVFEAVDGVDALKVLKENPDIQLSIVDYNMPNMDGFELTKEIRKKYVKDEMIIIGISAHGNNIVSAKFIKNGANDYINKPFVIEEFYCRVTQNIDTIEYIQTIKDYSNKDFLTGLYNRRYLFDVGLKLFANAQRKNLSILIAMIDIDHFKKINDTFGHDSGDEVIKAVSSILQNFFRKSDVVARIGGEEFCIVATNFSYDYVKKNFNDLRKTMEEMAVYKDGKTIYATISIGVCTMLQSSFENMIKIADDMLYISKEEGRNRVTIFNE
ncbi:MAG: diguanylate cyclase [Desulfobacterales bacterium]|nr:diguanylate cyclase [Desulfobacterales bacterium]